jgi:hypothetical protein
LERNLKIDDKILKFMTVLKADKVDPEVLEKEIRDAAGKNEKKEVPVPAPETTPAAAVEQTDAAGAVETDPPARKESVTQGEKEI